MLINSPIKFGYIWITRTDMSLLQMFPLLMKIKSIWFTAPRTIEVRSEKLPVPAPGQVQVETLCSAISPGTEMLIYRGQFPIGMDVDTGIDALEGALAYPLKYGYAAVGEVVELGKGVDKSWQGRQVYDAGCNTGAWTGRRQ